MRSNLQQWEQRLQQMKDCKSIGELLRQFGAAPHKVPQDGFEIWHYPLGADPHALQHPCFCVARPVESDLHAHGAD